MKGFEVDLGIDKGGVYVAVPQHVGDGLERLAAVEQAGGKAVAQGMGAQDSSADPHAAQARGNPEVKVVGIQGVDGSTVGQKDFAIGSLKAAMAQVAEVSPRQIHAFFAKHAQGKADTTRGQIQATLRTFFTFHGATIMWSGDTARAAAKA